MTDLTSSEPAHRTWAGATSIRGQILLAFLAMSIITASLGFFAVRALEHEGLLIDRTFDRSLMSVNFARAAAADFAGLQAAVSRRAFSRDAEARAKLDETIASLESTMDDDLSIAVERAQSRRVVATATKVQTAMDQWKVAQKEIAKAGDAAPIEKTTAAWAAFDRQGAKIGQLIDLLINYTAGDGFTYRQNAHQTTWRNRRLNIAATALALFVSAWISWLLSRRVLSPIRQASAIARKIADGDLDVVVPRGKSDELGALLAAMEEMRGNIKASMDREVELRRSAQTRLADALEGSGEGIVVIGPEERIVLANAQASRLVDVEAPFRAGDPADRLATALAAGSSDKPHLDYGTKRDVEVGEGRWLRVSQSATREGGSIFVYSDITVEKEQQAALRTANLWLDAALDNLSHGLCLFDSENQLKVFNQRFCDLFGLRAETVHAGMTLNALIEAGHVEGWDPEMKSVLLKRMERLIAARTPADKLLKLTPELTLAVSHRPLEDGSWLATYEDVTDRMQAADKITYMARHDALTGLPNRVFFAERIEAALAAADRGERFALLCLDLDHFKEVNDTLGHPIGDELLRAVAGRLNNAIREIDMVARLGGDEFAVIQTRIGGPEDVDSLARRIIAALNEPFDIEGHPVSIGVSIGVSVAPTDGLTYNGLLKNADMALYRAKADGRNGWRFFERAMDERQQARRLLELDLREALARDQFELDYQPVVDVEKGRICGFEALVRWRHPVRGLVPPSGFIPIAEEMGLITQIGDWVLHRACRDAATWPDDISVAVNASAAQLRNGGLHDAVVAALKRSRLEPRRLVLEITESVLIANAQNAAQVLDRLKSMGIRIAMDDFGTGYSSLSYLRSFPFDMVKIDQSFIREVTLRPEAAAIVRAIIALSQSLGMRTTAEGIETEDQLAFLEAEGCHEAQGYFFSRPIPAAGVPEMLGRRVDASRFAEGATRAA